MSKEKIIKAFSEIYLGQDPMKIAEKYERDKKKTLLLLSMISGILLLLCVIRDRQNSQLEEGNRILRANAGESREEISLQMQTDTGEWQEIEVTLYPKEYAEQELEQLLTEICEIIPEEIKAKNESLELVTSHLSLPQEIQGYPFQISWTSRDPQIIAEDGTLVKETDFEGTIELTACFQYEDWEREVTFPVYVIQKKETDFVSDLAKALKEKESLTRQETEFYLPDNFQEETIRWRYPPGNTALFLGILFGILLPLIAHEKDKEIYRQAKRREEQLEKSFPEFISKLILYMEAGMSIQGSVVRIVQDHQKKPEKKKSYLYEELSYLCRQMKNGLSEREGYELLGKRCSLPCYKKLSGLLVQHLQKGGSSILDTLRREAQKAGEEQRRQMEKRGEEMSTKLLVPMMILLGIVMVFIMVPALFSFQM